MFNLHEVEYSLVLPDIELYLWGELACIEPSKPQITLLAQLAGNLFIFAASAVRYIRPDEAAVHSTERLNTVLDNKSLPGSKRLAGIDSLYSTIPASALENNYLEAEEIKRIHNVLWTTVCIQEPVTIETLAVLASLQSTGHASTALEPLRSVLHVSARTGLVCTLHTSFPDYLFHGERSGRFFLDKAENHRLLAHRCFKVMERQLRFNIRNLQTSYVFDHAVADLKDRIESNIPASLEYTCQHWANHLCLAPGSLELCHTIYEFLTTKLLFWMELLNLKQHQMTGLYALPNAQRWVAGTDASYDLRILIHDAIIFVTRFFVSPVSLSTPHIYISALPVSAGRVRDIYSKKFTGLLWPEAHNNHTFQHIDLTLEPGKHSAFTCVALSSDGARVGVGSSQGLVELWDLGACKMIASSYVGRAKSILTVQFSPDREYIVSGTREGSVWMSKYFEGQLINACGPFETHKENVWSVNFSADGMYIASASSDGNVCIWDIVKRCLVVELCQGHSGSVRSVKFSPDGMKVAWGSDDCSVCIWNPVTGELILGPLERHSDVVWSLDFSPDGRFLVSGSNDGTLCVWDATCGSLIAFQPDSEAYREGILSVSFSSGGNLVYCGFQDNSLRVWNIVNEQLTLSEFQTHMDGDCSIVIFPDGVHILSSQHSHVIKIDNKFTSSDKREGVGLFGGRVLSHPETKAGRLGFSIDGERIISSSKSRSVTCVWESASGELLERPLKGCLDTSWSVTFPGGNTRIAARSNGHIIHIWGRDYGMIVAGPFQEGISRVFRSQLSLNGQRTISTDSTTLAPSVLCYQTTHQNFLAYIRYGPARPVA